MKVEKESPSLISAARLHFSGWETAVKAAGIDYNREISLKRKWTKEDVIVEIRKLKSKGINLSHRKLGGEYGKLKYAGYKLFGTWEQAVRAAGIDYGEYLEIRKWSREKVIEVIRKRAAEGKSLSRGTATDEEGKKLFQAVFRYFGSMSAARKAALETPETTSSLEKKSKKHNVRIFPFTSK